MHLQSYCSYLNLVQNYGNVYCLLSAMTMYVMRYAVFCKLFGYCRSKIRFSLTYPCSEILGFDLNTKS